MVTAELNTEVSVCFQPDFISLAFFPVLCDLKGYDFPFQASELIKKFKPALQKICPC